MEAKSVSRQGSLLLLAAMAVMVSQIFAVSSVPIEDQKNYYTPDPNTPTVPNLPIIPPPASHHGGGTPPVVNCGNPPKSGGHHHTTKPSPPTTGGGSHHSPPTTTTPIVPVTPSPTTPIVTPTTPSPPSSFDPNSPPFTCTYWRNHPTLIWGLFGWWGTTVGTAFGVNSLPGFGANTNIVQALSNTRSDGLGQLYREGTAALLNSMAHTRFPYTTGQVRDSFVAALGSNKAAAAQAQVFRMANEGRTKAKP